MSEIWEASGKYVFRGKDCIGIFDTDTGTDALMEERARVAAAAPDLLAAVDELVCFCIAQGWNGPGIDAGNAALVKAGGGKVIDFPPTELDQQIGGGGL